MLVGKWGSGMVLRVAFSEPPGAAAAVMATGVLGLCVQRVGPGWLAGALVAVAAGQWGVVLLVFALDAVVDPVRWRREVDLPAALALVAGTAVLGAEATALGGITVAEELLALAVALWVVLLPRVLRHWHAPGPGSGFLVCVSTQSLAVLAAGLAAAAGPRWLGQAATAAFLAGLSLYVVAAARFDWRQLVRGRGDQWVAAGALAISSLAASSVAAAVQVPSPLRIVALGLWCAAAAGCLLLAGAEVARPRLRYCRERWSTVFPLGMLALAALSTPEGAHGGWLRAAGTALAWLALAVWLPVAAGAAVRLAHALARAGRGY